NGVIAGTQQNTLLTLDNGATLDLNGNNARVGGLAGDGTVLLGTNGTLIIGNAGGTFSGLLSGGAGSTLIFNGTGTESIGNVASMLTSSSTGGNTGNLAGVGTSAG